MVAYAGIVKGSDGLATGRLGIEVKAAAEGAKAADEWLPPARAATKLVGAWEPDGGKAVTFAADGTGRNADGSRFRWRLEGDFLVAQAVGEKGPIGDPVRILTLFAEDGRERVTLLEGGKLRTAFHKLGPDGKRDGARTAEGKAYRRKPVAEADDGDGPALVPGPKRDKDDPPKAGAGRVGPNVRVSKARADVFHAEVVLAADPTDPKRLVAASMCTPPAAGPADSKVVVYTSSDGGATWAVALERTAADPDQYADPTLAFGPGGSVFFGCMAFPSLDRSREAGRLEVVRSGDGGTTWGEPVRVDEFHDRPFLALDRTGGKLGGRLYCVTHRGVLANAADGKAFGAVVPWPARDGYVPYSPANPVVLSDGTLVALHGGRQAPTAPKAATPPDPGMGYLAAGRSTDGGATLSDDRAVAEYTASARFSNVPSLAADPGSAAFNDRLYAAWVDHPKGKAARVVFARSADRGATWSEPVLLSEQPDAPGPDRPDHDAFLPTVAVNKAGVVGVTWYDSRGLPERGEGWDVRFRASADGGVTWPPSVRVTEESTVNDRAKKRRFGTGHTAGLAADADGVFHALWADGRTGIGQVWTAAVTAAPAK
jgi:hypothetical protein